MSKLRKLGNEHVILVILLLIGFFFATFGYTYPVKLIKQFVYYAVYPNIAVANLIFDYTGDFADNIKATVRVRQENIAYKQRNRELTDKLRNYDAICKEYDDLLKLLGLPKVSNTVSVFARISSREPNEWYQWFIIDKGQADGLRAELPVVMVGKENNKLYAAGRIIETYKNSSKIAIITNPTYVLPVEIKGKGINCLAEGCDSNLLRITYIPFNVDVSPGDKVVVSALSSVFQKGISVGVIVDVSKDDSMDFKTASAKVFFEENTLPQVVVLVPKAEEV